MSDARTIAVVAGKGGVGKTTAVMNLAAAFAETGQECLVVDCDPQANLTFGLGFDTSESRPTICEVLRREVTPAAAILSTAHAGLDLLPGSTELVSVEATLSSSLGRELFLREALDANGVRHRYGYVLFDTPPSFGYHTILALAAARFVIVPLQMSGFALHGLGEVVRTVSVARRCLNPELMLLGTVPTFVEKRTNFSRDMLDGVRETASLRVFQSSITRSVRIQETSLLRLPVLSHAPGSPSAAQYRALAGEVAGAISLQPPAAPAPLAAVVTRPSEPARDLPARMVPEAQLVGRVTEDRLAFAGVAVSAPALAETAAAAAPAAVAVLEREPAPEAPADEPEDEVSAPVELDWSLQSRPLPARRAYVVPKRRGISAWFRFGRRR